jgi:hypothetical protein
MGSNQRDATGSLFLSVPLTEIINGLKQGIQTIGTRYSP